MEHLVCPDVGDVVCAVGFTQAVVGCDPTEAKAILARILVSSTRTLVHLMAARGSDERSPLVTRQQAEGLLPLLQAQAESEMQLRETWSRPVPGWQTVRILARE
jgi:hypothetical protein